jgi:2-polyprenyl-6-methoxyphenol hydroxylase-like FAD-dependent oxidoreductase
MKFVDAGDRTIARVEIAGASEVEIMRGDLVALLREVTSGVEYLFGDSIRHLEQDDDGVTVAFDHAETRRFDLVVGADGLHSTVRRLAFGPEEHYLRYRHHYFAFANADAALGEDRWVTMYNEPGRMAGIYRSGNHAAAKAYFVFRSRPLSYDHRDIDQHKRLVSAAFEGDAWRTRDLLAAAVADPEFYFDALSQVRMTNWHSGRIVLIGDAAWCPSPASGAGAELAVTGAYRLADELAAAAGDHRVAFPRFRAAHSRDVRKRQRIGTNVRLMVPRTAAGAWARNAAARLPLPRPATTS